MSWRDYTKKKKNNILEESDTRINQQKFVPKEQTSEEKTVGSIKDKVSNIMRSNQQSVSTWDKVKYLTSEGSNRTRYVGKMTGAGILGGVTGIAQSYLTDTANQLKQGEEKNKVQTLTNLSKKMLASDEKNTRTGMIDTVKSNIDILRDENKNTWQKVAGIGMNTVSGATNSLPFKQKTNAVIQAIGSFLKDKGTSDAVLDVNKAISKPSDTLNQKLAQEGQKYGKATQFVGNAMQSVGNMLPSIATTVATGDPTARIIYNGIKC